jgi:hypothetical protein
VFLLYFRCEFILHLEIFTEIYTILIAYFLKFPSQLSHEMREILKLTYKMDIYHLLQFVKLLYNLHYAVFRI